MGKKDEERRLLDDGLDSKMTWHSLVRWLHNKSISWRNVLQRQQYMTVVDGMPLVVMDADGEGFISDHAAVQLDGRLRLQRLRWNNRCWWDQWCVKITCSRHIGRHASVPLAVCSCP